MCVLPGVRNVVWIVGLFATPPTLVLLKRSAAAAAKDNEAPKTTAAMRAGVAMEHLPFRDPRVAERASSRFRESLLPGGDSCTPLVAQVHASFTTDSWCTKTASRKSRRLPFHARLNPRPREAPCSNRQPCPRQ